MNEVYGQFFDVDREELYQPDAALPNAPPRDLFVFDDQLHMVRSSQNGPHVFLAFVQGPSAAAGSQLQEEPVPARRPGRRARPALVGARPQARRRADQQRIAAPQPLHPGRLLRQPGHGRAAQRRHARRLPARRPERAPAGELHRVAAGGEPHRAPDRGDPQLRQPHLGLAAHARARPALSRRAQPRVHGAADPGEPSRLVEGLQHRLRRQGRRRSEQPDAALAARRREGRLPDLRADRAPQGAAREASRLLQHLHPQGLLALARRHARDGQPDRHPEGLARLAAVHLHHLPRVLGRHGAVRLVAAGARRHPRRAQLPERRAEPAVADAVRPDLRPAAQRRTPRSARPSPTTSSPGRRCARTCSASC